jgi:site-specific recombinase XerD
MSSLPQIASPAGAPAWNWERVRALVLASVSSPHSRRAYGKAVDDFWGWCREAGAAGFTRETVQRYRAQLESRGLAPSTLNLHLTAIRKLASEAAASGILPAEATAAIAGVKGTRQKGTHLGAWLTLEQARALLGAPAGDGLRARRDRALLALLLGCGLRRAELAALDFDHVAAREGRWVLVDLEGKGKRVRSVPMPTWAKTALDRWTAAAGITKGRLFRALSQKGTVGEALTAQAVYLIVGRYADQIGVRVAPHDLRRTFARLAHNGRSPLEQIQLSLGHESIQTTERYLGVRQNLTDAPCDHLGIELANS